MIVISPQLAAGDLQDEEGARAQCLLSLHYAVGVQWDTATATVTAADVDCLSCSLARLPHGAV